MSREPITVNGRTYAWPARPLVVVCVDGCEPDYLTQAFLAGAMPFLSSAVERGESLLGAAVIPSFTNPNNLSILTGFSEAGASVAVVTAKDKLRRLLGHGMRGTCFSSEKADATTMAEHGIDNALTFVGRPR